MVTSNRLTGIQNSGRLLPQQSPPSPPSKIVVSSVLTLDNIRKSYGKVQALKGVSFSIPEGAVFGILGPNGSGKTTLLGIVLDILKADDGSYAWFNGLPPADARKQLGALLETPNFYHYLNADENLRINAKIKGRGEDDIDRVLGLVGLKERRGSKFSTYSLGMKQRLAIGSALLGRPKVLVLDEPTNGLDPAGIAEIRSLIRSLSSDGTTVIMASHLLDEVERVCTHMAIMLRGKLLVSGDVQSVLQQEDEIEIDAADRPALERVLNANPAIRYRRDETGYVIAVQNDLSAESINQLVTSQGIWLNHLVLRQKRLESTFMELTGGESA
jgi:ABC-2 type transport system ATP-binding protein